MSLRRRRPAEKAGFVGERIRRPSPVRSNRTSSARAALSNTQNNSRPGVLRTAILNRRMRGAPFFCRYKRSLPAPPGIAPRPKSGKKPRQAVCKTGCRGVKANKDENTVTAQNNRSC